MYSYDTHVTRFLYLYGYAEAIGNVVFFAARYFRD
jgi:hypothetical protein